METEYGAFNGSEIGNANEPFDESEIESTLPFARVIVLPASKPAMFPPIDQALVHDTPISVTSVVPTRPLALLNEQNWDGG